jgi:hypothetical protein
LEKIAGGNGQTTVVIEDGAVQGATLPDPAADEPQRLDARAHAGDGPTADAEAMPRPRKRAAAGLFEESAAK